MPPKRRALAEADANASAAKAKRAKKTKPRVSTTSTATAQQGSEETGNVPAAPSAEVQAQDAQEMAAAPQTHQQTQSSPGYHPTITRSSRWSAVSNSANIDMNYKDATKDPEEAYSYICMCHAPRFATEKGSSEQAVSPAPAPAPAPVSASASSQDGQQAPKRPPCDYGDTCICKQPASQHPGHDWILSYAGYYRFGCQRCHAETRSPDNFGVSSFPEHEGYGAVEVVQNLFLDFEEARQAKNRSEQWAVVEATAMFLLSDWGAAVATIDDGETLRATAALVSRMVLATLATLQHAGLLRPDSEVRNIGLVMAMYLKLAHLLRKQSALEPSKLTWASPTATPAEAAAETTPATKKGGRKGKGGSPALAKAKAKAGKKGAFDFHPTRFASYVLTYSTQHGIALAGVEAMNSYTRALDAYITLPKAGADPWGWADAFAAYQRSCVLPVARLGLVIQPPATGKMGGDAFDMTTWASEERSARNWQGRDALGARELHAIREGFVLDINHR